MKKLFVIVLLVLALVGCAKPGHRQWLSEGTVYSVEHQEKGWIVKYQFRFNNHVIKDEVHVGELVDACGDGTELTLKSGDYIHVNTVNGQITDVEY